MRYSHDEIHVNIVNLNKRLSPGPSGPKRTAKDLPMHSRLFVIYGKELGQEDLRKAFAPFGNLEDVYLTKNGGVAYIKFSKASEAAQAIEGLNGKVCSIALSYASIITILSNSQ